MEGRIDVHHHIMPPQYVETMGEGPIGSPSVSRKVPVWTRDSATEILDKHGIAGAITSISAPGVLLSDAKDTARLARLCNDYSARLAKDYPGRFGTFASLPLPDVAASIQECDYALDVLKVEGIVLMTNYRDKYLGDPEFAPLMDHLNAHDAIVFVHPTNCSCGDCHPAASASLLEFPFDTTRTIVSLLLSRTLERCPNIRFIFSHGGGAVPYLAGRLTGLLARNPMLDTPLNVNALLRGLYYDTALSATRPVFAALREITSIEHILFGTDYPFAPDPQVGATLKGLKEAGLDEREVRMVESENARRLLVPVRERS